MLRYLLALSMALAIGSTSFADETAADDKAKPKVTFDEHIKPIFREKCLTCHNQGDAKGGLALDSFSALMQGGGSGEVVYDGDAESSRLWQLVAHEDTPVMPPKQDKIAQAKIDLIRDWINGGLLENAGSKAKKKKASPLAFAGASTGKPEGEAAMPESVLQQPVVLSDRGAAASAIAASPWAPLVAVAGQRQIVLYNTDSGELVGILPFPEGLVHSLRFSRDGSFIIAGGGEDAALGIVAVYDVKTGDRLTVVGDELDTVLGSDVNDRMTRIALGGPQKMLRIYDLADGELLFDIKKHTDWICDVAYSPDGVLLASCDRAAGLMVWEAETGRNYLNLTDHKAGINALAWRDDSNVLASASDDGTVKLWEMNEGKVIKSINAHGGGVVDVAFDHQGQLITCGKDRRVKLWDATGNQKVVFPAMPEQVLEVTVSHDSSRIIAGDWTGQVISWPQEKPEENAQPLPSNPPSLEQRIESSKQELAGLAEPVTTAEAALAAVQKQLTDATNRKTEMMAQQQQKTQLAEQKKAEQAAAVQAVAAFTKERDQLTADSKQQEQAVKQAREQMDAAAKAEGEDAEPQLADAKEKLAAEEKTLAETQQKLAAKQEEVVAKEAAVKELAAAEKTLRDEANKLTPMMAEADKQMVDLNTKLAEAQATVAAAKSARDAMAAQVQRLEGELQKFQQRAAELAKAAEAAEAAAARLQSQAALFTSAYAN